MQQKGIVVYYIKKKIESRTAIIINTCNQNENNNKKITLFK